MPKSGVILKNTKTNSLLMIKGVQSQLWGFPKGSSEVGETDIECAKRELYEETGIRIKLDKRKTIKIYCRNYYLVEGDFSSLKPQIQDNSEIEDVKWVRTNKIIDLDLNSDVKLYLSLNNKI